LSRWASDKKHGRWPLAGFAAQQFNKRKAIKKNEANACNGQQMPPTKSMGLCF
jgi:hypothetical protein